MSNASFCCSVCGIKLHTRNLKFGTCRNHRRTEPDRPTLGQAIWFSAKLEKEFFIDGVRSGARWVSKKFEMPQRGIYIGMRTVYDGTVQRGTYEDPSHLEVERGVTHAIVITHERKAPVRVPFDAIHYVYEDLSQQPATL